MSEDTFGTPAEDFDPFYVQAESALMELDAMARGELLADPLSEESAVARSAGAYTARTGPGDYGALIVVPDVRKYLD